jgi:octaprenyl-diphosphate synthase
LADDILDYISEEDQFGKVKGTDLKEGKLTLPLIVALRHCSTEERRLIKDILIAENLEEMRLRETISIINKYGGIDYTIQLARSFSEKAKAALLPFKPSIEKEALLSLAHYATDRKQ